MDAVKSTSKFVQAAVVNWKSTVQGLLGAMIALGVYCAVTPTTFINQKAAGIIAFVTGAAKVLLGMLQKD